MRRREMLAQGARAGGLEDRLQRAEDAARSSASTAPLDGLPHHGQPARGRRHLVAGGGRRGDRRVRGGASSSAPTAGSIAALLPALELADEPRSRPGRSSRSWPATSSTAPWPSGRASRPASRAPRRILVNGEEQHAVPADRDRRAARSDGRGRRPRDWRPPARSSVRATASSPAILAPPHDAAPGDTVRLDLEALGGVELRFS